MEWQAYIDKFINNFSRDMMRYVLFAGVPYVLFYLLFKNRTFRMKIQQRYPKLKDVRREVLYSISSVAVFAMVSVFLLYLKKHDFTKIYMDMDAFGGIYFGFSIVLLIVLHDTWFYWTHRLMHWKPIFKYVHLVHHKSTDPTPWAAFSFHPTEAFIQIAYVPIMVCLVPLHPIAILTWALYQFTLNMLGHLGFELLPKGFTKSKWTFWHNTSTHHNMHHKYFSCNYSLYFNVWDRLMGTNHKKYDEMFEEVCERRAGKALNEERAIA
ncbi:MAG: sterol desaturase [Flavobacteriales bacterium]|nr:sterol desaturase [Flavobacteriales bacterium]